MDRGNVPAPQPPAPAGPTLQDVATSLNNLNAAVILRDNNLDSRLTAIEKMLQALIAAAPKG